MGIIVKTKKHLLTRVPLLFFLIGLFALSPVLISIIGAQITEWLTNQPCHEGNCFWGAFGWFFFFTFPIAGFLFIALAIIVLIDSMRLGAGKNNHHDKEEAGFRE